LSHPWTFKGGTTVLLALKRLSKRYKNLALITIGNPDKQYINTLRKFSPYNFPVLNLGWVYGKTKYDIFSACDVFAMPSISDAFGLVYLEAWASKKPVIGAKDTAAEDIIRDGHDGFLVEYGNVQQLEEKLLLLYEKETLREQMGSEGKLRVEHDFCPQNTMKAFEYVMERVL
jgi:glycosyltransferase involved in cell wall biosynthesis